MICSDLFASARKAVFPAPTATGVHRLRNTWSSLLSQPVANYASFTSRIQVHGKGPRKNKVGATATGGSGCGGWGRRNLPQKSSTVLSEPKISLSPLGYSTSEPEKHSRLQLLFSHWLQSAGFKNVGNLLLKIGERLKSPAFVSFSSYDLWLPDLPTDFVSLCTAWFWDFKTSMHLPKIKHFDGTPRIQLACVVCAKTIIHQAAR